MRKNLTLIQAYYERAWKYILSNDISSALRVIHNEMPVDLYDLSLNIWESNGKLSSTDAELVTLYEETKQLVGKVDNRLSEISTEGLHELAIDEDLDTSDLQQDKFSDQY